MLYSVLDFRNLFTLIEKEAIYTAMASNIKIKIWMDDLAVSKNVDVCASKTIESVSVLESAGLIGLGRAAQILNNWQTVIGTASILSPFHEHYPDIYNITALKADGTATLEGVGDFASQYYTRVT